MPIQIPNVIGLPPKSNISNAALENSLPVLQITPGAPAQVNTLTTFVFKERLVDYLTKLEAHGFTFEDLDVEYLKVAIIPDSFPSETFTNEYSENFLQKMGDVASESLGQLSQMTGNRTGTGTIRSVGNAMSKAFSDTSLSGLVDTVNEGVQKGIQGAKNAVGRLDNRGFEGALKQMAGMADVLAGGARVDMPQLWRNSSYSPSYSFTVRLFNPEPGSWQSTSKFIIGPLAALLLLALPHAQNGGVYSWPYIHNISCPGMFLLSPAYISSINIVKGWDQQQIAWNQRLGIVDLRLECSSLFNSIVVEGTPGSFRSTRPTLSNYLSSLEDYREINDPHSDPYNSIKSDIVEVTPVINT